MKIGPVGVVCSKSVEEFKKEYGEYERILHEFLTESKIPKKLEGGFEGQNRQ